MDNSLLFLKIEIILFLIFLLYILYYFIYNTIWFLKHFLSLFRFKKRSSIIQEKNKIIKPVKKKESYTSQNEVRKVLTDDEKLMIKNLLNKAKLNISRWELDFAKNAIIEWLVIDKFNKELNIELANIYIHENDYIKAEYIYRDLLLVHSWDYDIIKKLAYILSMQEKYDLAIEMYLKCFSQKNDDMEIVNMLWHLYYFKEDYLSAIKFLKIFIKNNPRDAEALMLIAYSYKKLWEYKESLVNFKRVLEIQPYNEDIKNEINNIELMNK